MGYSSKDSRVRVTLFKESGKWYSDESVDMYDRWSGCATIHDALMAACADEFEAEEGAWSLSSHPLEWLESGGTIVCLDPYHEHAHPIMLTPAFARKYAERYNGS